MELAAAQNGGDLVEEIDAEHPEETQYGINIQTPYGVKRASLGMYLVKFAGQNFVQHVRVFEEIYEPVNKDSPPPESIGDTRRRLGFGDAGGPVRI